MSRRLGVYLCAGLSLVLWACGGGGTPAPQAGPRRIMLQDLGQLVIVPTYETLVAEASNLVAAATTLEATPAADALTAAQTAWRRARAAWKQSEAFAIGPAETLRTANRIDWSPIRADRIETALAGTDEISAAWVEDLGTNLKGFLAIEYLLFDPAGGDAAVLTTLQGDAGARRRAFIRAAAENLRDQTILLRDAWTPTGGNFVTTLATAGPGNATFPTVKSAVDKLVNQLIFLAEDIADHQLLMPLGVRNGGTPRPDLIDANRSGNGMADLLDNLTGLQNVYYAVYDGRRGQGLSAIVATLNPTTDNVLGLAIQRSFETATRISVPLEEAISDQADLVTRAQVRTKELMERLEVDLVSVLGSTLRFNPSDGD
ncbi:MAG: imelysin family protein [Deltaproteobacteria bacterium]|nr:imelysin family protein [Deltaproteobacteria bacterium]